MIKPCSTFGCSALAVCIAVGCRGDVDTPRDTEQSFVGNAKNVSRLSERPLKEIHATPGLQAAVKKAKKLIGFSTFSFFGDAVSDNSIVVCQTSEGSGRFIGRIIVLKRTGEDTWKVPFQSEAKDYVDRPPGLWIVEDQGEIWLEEREKAKGRTSVKRRLFRWHP